MLSPSSDLKLTLGKRLGAYFFNAFLVAVLPLVVLYVAVRVAHVDAFSQIAFAQSLGGLCSVVVSYGWSVSGPVAIAQADSASRERLFAESVALKVWLFFPVVGLTVLTMAITGRLSSLQVLPLVTSALGAFMSSWYFVGAGEATKVVYLETLPRILLTLGAAGLALCLKNVWWLLVGQAVGAIVPPIICSVVVVGGPIPAKLFRPDSVRASLRNYRDGAMVSAVTAAYVATPAFVVGLVDLRAVAAFSAGQRVQQLASASFSPIVQLLQGWTPSESDKVTAEHVRRALAVGVLGAVILGFAVWSFGPALIGALTGGRIDLDLMSRISIAWVVACMAASQVSGLVCLTSFGQMKDVLKSCAAGAALGSVMIPFAAVAGGGKGVWVAVAIVEGVILAYQLVLLRRPRRGTIGVV